MPLRIRWVPGVRARHGTKRGFSSSWLGTWNLELNPDGGQAMKSPIIKHSVVVDGHKTSVSLEDQFWDSLKEVADETNMPLSKLIGQIDHGRTRGNLSSAIRLFVLSHFQ